MNLLAHLTFATLVTLASISSFASSKGEVEPSFCSEAALTEKIIQYPTKGLDRLQLFKLGRVYVAGLGVGNSKTESIIQMVTQFSKASKAQNYCTWYFNEGNGDAEDSFNHRYLDNPKSLDEKSGPLQYRQRLEEYFSTANNGSFTSCLEDFGMLTMGCNGQRHRGPTVFGMLLAFSGCSPKTANDFVNKTWGLNQVKKSVRLAIIEEGARMREQYPDVADRLRSLFESETLTKR